MLFNRKDVYTVNKLPLKGKYIHKLALFSIYFSITANIAPVGVILWVNIDLISTKSIYIILIFMAHTNKPEDKKRALLMLFFIIFLHNF